MNKTPHWMLTASLAAFPTAPTLADDWASGRYLTGDRGGKRQALAEHGVDFSFRSSDGVSVMTQLEWDWNWDGRPGHLGVGINNVWFEMPVESGISFPAIALAMR